MRFLRTEYPLVFILCLFVVACSQPADDSIAPPPAKEEVTPQLAAIAIPDPYAAKIAAHILQQGGNAVDAAVATGFALAVTYIDAGNIGGGGFMLSQMNGESSFLDYREKAPLAAHRDMYLDENGEVIPSATLIGAPAAAVPGTVAGLWKAHQRYGNLPWNDVVMPSADLAEAGFYPAQILVDDIRAHYLAVRGQDQLRRILWRASAPANYSSSRRLAATLRRIAKNGRTNSIVAKRPS